MENVISSISLQTPLLSKPEQVSAADQNVNFMSIISQIIDANDQSTVPGSMGQNVQLPLENTNIRNTVEWQNVFQNLAAIAYQGQIQTLPADATEVEVSAESPLVVTGNPEIPEIFSTGQLQGLKTADFSQKGIIPLETSSQSGIETENVNSFSLEGEQATLNEAGYQTELEPEIKSIVTQANLDQQTPLQSNLHDQSHVIKHFADYPKTDLAKTSSAYQIPAVAENEKSETVTVINKDLPQTASPFQEQATIFNSELNDIYEKQTVISENLKSEPNSKKNNSDIQITQNTEMPVASLLNTANSVSSSKVLSDCDVKDLSNDVKMQLTKAIKENFSNGKNEFTMQLNPVQLGKVTVKIAVKDAHLVIDIAAEDAKAQSVISANSGELKSLLSEHMGVPITIQVESNNHFNYTDSGHQGRNNPQEEQGKQQNQNGQTENYTTDFVTLLDSLGILKQV